MEEHDLFLSYNSADREQVLRVRAALVRLGLNTFYDQESLNPGGLWFDDLQLALRRVRGVAVFLGPHGLGPWQKREMGLGT
jgi:TIR domain